MSFSETSKKATVWGEQELIVGKIYDKARRRDMSKANLVMRAAANLS